MKRIMLTTLTGLLAAGIGAYLVAFRGSLALLLLGLGVFFGDGFPSSHDDFTGFRVDDVFKGVVVD